MEQPTYRIIRERTHNNISSPAMSSNNNNFITLCENIAIVSQEWANDIIDCDLICKSYDEYLVLKTYRDNLILRQNDVTQKFLSGIRNHISPPTEFIIPLTETDNEKKTDNIISEQPIKQSKRNKFFKRKT